jgi:hypothetical protein
MTTRKAVAQIPVESREEADLIVTGLEDDSVRAFVKVMGALLPLEPRAQERVLRFVTDHFGLRT